MPLPNCFRGAVLVFVLAAAPGWGQSPSYGVGRAPTPEEIEGWDIAIAPDGEGLPAGRGTPVDGREVFAKRCADCHGAEGQGADKGEALVGGMGTLKDRQPLKTVGSFWPYATTVWDYVNRAMPFDRPGTLTHDQVYSVVAFLLYLNGIIDENQEMNAESLPQVKMPNREGFVPDPRPDIEESR